MSKLNNGAGFNENGYKALVVDDEPSIRFMCKRALARNSFLVTTCESADKAVENVENWEEFDVALLDINMPGMDGLDLLDRIKKISPTTEVIMITASHELDYARTALRHQAHDYLLKPFGAGDLVLAAERAAETSRLKKDNRAYQRDLERRVDKKTRQLLEEVGRRESLLISTVFALAEAVEHRDKYTEDHARRIAGYCGLITETLGMDEDETRKVILAGILHDIGKIGVPDDVLYKNGPLLDEEWKMLKKHADIGSRILERIEGMSPIARMVRAHHERFDGNGYPDGLSGEQIPLGARVLCVADSFDAMTTNRPYRDAMSLSDAIHELDRMSGKQFDPRVAEAFVKKIEKLSPGDAADAGKVAERSLAVMLEGFVAGVSGRDDGMEPADGENLKAAV